MMSEVSARPTRDPAPGSGSGGPRFCVYTVAFGTGYALPDLSVGEGSTVDFIAFVDDPTRTSRHWQIRHLPPVLPADLPRSNKLAKMLPHVLLPDHDASLYVDCTVDLKVAPEILFNDFLVGHTDTMALFRHSQHAGLDEEVAAILTLDFDSPERIEEQYAAYAALGFSADGPLIWSGMMLRWHHHPAVIRAMERWAWHVMRYSRRDQLSLSYVLQETGCPVLLHDLDNRCSPYHRWPVPIERPHPDWRYARPNGDTPPVIGRILGLLEDHRRAAARPAQEHLRGLELRVQQQADTAAALSREIDVVSASLDAANTSLEQGRKEREQVRQDLEQAGQELEQARKEIDHARQELEQARQRLEQAKLDQSAVQARSHDLECRNEALRDEIMSCRAALEQMRSSTSWRVTTPLRALRLAVAKMVT